MVRVHHGLGAGKRFYLIICIFLCSIIIYGQYINPEFGGVASTGFGEVSGQSIGQYSGLYNPATLNPNIGRINFSTLTGQYSDYLLYYPTLKDVSISYPLIKHQLAFQIHYGRSRDNSLRYFRSGTWYKNPFYFYNGGRQSAGVTVEYSPPLNRWFRKGNLFDFSAGLDISRVWGHLTYNDPTNNVSRFWLNNVKYLPGANITFGTFTKLDFGSRLKWLLSTVIQGGIADNLNNKWLELYSIGAGFVYRPSGQSNNSLQMGFEVENIQWLRKRKLGVGLKYNFTNHVENSLQCGIYTYPKNYENYTFSQQQVHWYTLGFTKSISSAIFIISLSDAINLNLSKNGINSSDIAKVVSLGISVPIPTVNNYRFNKPEKTPEFVDYQLKNRRIVLGQTDTLSFLIQYFGAADFESNNVYFNVTPKTGLILPVPFTSTPVLRHNDIFEIKIPFQAIPSQPVKDYTIYATLTYDNNKTIRKEFAITSVKPIINVSTTLGNLHRYFLFPVPGSYILEFNIRNDGTITSDSFEIILSDNIVDLGFVESNAYRIDDIKPGASKTFKIPINTTRADLPPRVPITISFNESMGFNPLPIHADIVIIDKNKISYSEDNKDPFITEFVDYDSFYIVMNPTWEEMIAIKNKTVIILKDNPNFPGRIITGPYDDINHAFAIRNTIDGYTKNYSLYAKTNTRLESMERFFFLVNDNDSVRDILTQLSIISFYADRSRPGKLLIGPYLDLVAVSHLEEFMKEFFPDNQIVLRYPNQVVLSSLSAETK